MRSWNQKGGPSTDYNPQTTIKTLLETSSQKKREIPDPEKFYNIYMIPLNILYV